MGVQAGACWLLLESSVVGDLAGGAGGGFSFPPLVPGPRPILFFCTSGWDPGGPGGAGEACTLTFCGWTWKLGDLGGSGGGASVLLLAPGTGGAGAEALGEHAAKGGGGGGGWAGGAGGSRTSWAGLAGSELSPGYPQGGRSGSGGGMGGRCRGASGGLRALSPSAGAEGSGGGGDATAGLPLVGGPCGDTSGALLGEEGGRGGGRGGGGGGAGTLGRGGTVRGAPGPSEAVPSRGEAGGFSAQPRVLVGSLGEGAREPGPCPALPPAASL